MARARRPGAATEQASLFDEPATAPTVPGAEAAVTPAAPMTPAALLDEQVASLPPAWRALLAPCLDTDNWRQLATFVDGERRAGKPVFPRDVFHALHLTPPEQVKVVILGQDPYHGTGVVDGAEIPQAHGLAFSVPDGIRVPPSLRNIYKEIAAEYGDGLGKPSVSGNLEPWARQGVLLLNTVLTVEQGLAASHARRGWEAVTDRLIAALAESQTGLVFLLWGSHAQAKASLIGEAHQAERKGGHLVLEAPHPSPLSAHRGFLGCGHFRAANEWLVAQGREAVDWLGH